MARVVVESSPPLNKTTAFCAGMPGNPLVDSYGSYLSLRGNVPVWASDFRGLEDFGSRYRSPSPILWAQVPAECQIGIRLVPVVRFDSVFRKAHRAGRTQVISR